MRLPRPTRRALAAFAAGAGLSAAALLVLLQPDAPASAAAPARATCSATVDVVGPTPAAPPYQSAFTVTSDAPFAEDRSKGTRSEVFTAAIVGDRVEVRYERDVSTSDSVRLETTLTFEGDRASQNGRSVSSTRGRPDVTMTYAVTCRR